MDVNLTHEELCQMNFERMLRGKMLEVGYDSLRELSDAIGFNCQTFYRKVNHPWQFTIREFLRMSDKLGLSPDDMRKLADCVQ